MTKLIPVLVDPPLSKHREFVCLWLNKKKEAKKPSHYLITKEQLLDIIANGIIEGQAKSFVCKDIQKKILKELGVE